MKKINSELMEVIASYMNDEIREDLHAKLAPCTPNRFLKAYLLRDPSFAEFIKNEFGIV